MTDRAMTSEGRAEVHGTSVAQKSPTARAPARHLEVWDLGVRVFHWLLVAAVAAAFASGFFLPARWLDAHLAAGTAVAALVAFRVVWGFTGSTHALFASFVVGPAHVVRHVRELLAGRGGRHLGHNPLGATMILALLAVLTLLAATGLVALGGELKQGPLAPFLTFATGHAAKGIHGALALGLLGLVALHVVGVTLETLRSRDGLVRAMLTGHKEDARPHQGEPAARSNPRLAAAVLGLLAAGATAAVTHFARQPALGVPVLPPDPVYLQECGACHFVHHPSLAPAATWRGIMTGLAKHFGDDARLDAPADSRLLAYLTANSAEHWDSKPANHLRTPDSAEPLRITASPGWMHLHRDLPPTAFAAKPVGGRFNCGACHADAASGRFAPQAIAIPTEGTR
jgi:cytochrome b